MRIGFSYWGVWDGFQPGHQLDTPDGHRYGRRVFMNEIMKRGHELVTLQKQREEHAFATKVATYDAEDPTVVNGWTIGTVKNEPTEFPEDLDMIFMEWRWPTWKNDRNHPAHNPDLYEPDLDRQLELIEFYHGRIPIVVWDTDLKVTPEHEESYPELILSDPSFETNRQTRKRVSLPFWTDWRPLFDVTEPYPIYGYIGNNYERADEFQKYYLRLGHDMRIMGIQTTMYGNWLQKSPERETPSYLISTRPHVAFNHRMNFYDSMKMMNRFITTTHVSKPRYYEVGFMSPRYIEANMVGCPALVPSAFRHRQILGERWVVDRPIDVVDRMRYLKDMSLEQRIEVVEEQREHLKRMGKFDVKDVVDFLESVV